MKNVILTVVAAVLAIVSRAFSRTVVEAKSSAVVEAQVASSSVFVGDVFAINRNCDGSFEPAEVYHEVEQFQDWSEDDFSAKINSYIKYFNEYKAAFFVAKEAGDVAEAVFCFECANKYNTLIEMAIAEREEKFVESIDLKAVSLEMAIISHDDVEEELTPVDSAVEVTTISEAVVVEVAPVEYSSFGEQITELDRQIIKLSVDVRLYYKNRFFKMKERGNIDEAVKCFNEAMVYNQKIVDITNKMGYVA